MPLSLDSANTFLRGKFNPFIISPDWLREQKVWEAEKLEFGLGVLQEGIQFKGDGVEWLIDNHGLVIASRKADVGEIAATVIARLPHTPIAAVGNNFVFACIRSDWGASPLPSLTGGKEPFDDSTIIDERWMASIKGDDVVAQVALTKGDALITVNFNYHRKPAKSSDAASAARNFENDKQRSVELIKSFFNQEVANVNDVN